VIGAGKLGTKECKAELLVNTPSGVVIAHGRVYDTSSTQINWPLFGDYLQTELMGEIILVQSRKKTQDLIQGDYPSIDASLTLRADMAATSRSMGFQVSWAQARTLIGLPVQLPGFDLVSATAVNLCQFDGDTSFLEDADARGWLDFWVLPSSAPEGSSVEEKLTWMSNMIKFSKATFAHGVFAMPSATAPSKQICDFVSKTGQIAARKYLAEPEAKRVRVGE
jgi:hypothetical protein